MIHFVIEAVGEGMRTDNAKETHGQPNLQLCTREKLLECRGDVGETRIMHGLS